MVKIEKSYHPYITTWIDQFRRKANKDPMTITADQKKNKGVSGNEYCIVMEFVKGVDLWDAVHDYKTGRFKPPQNPNNLKRVFFETLLGLFLVFLYFLWHGVAVEHMHRIGIYHRDIRTTSTLFDNDHGYRL